MKHPILGTTPDGKPLPIDIDKLVASRLLLQANSGGGKSWGVRRLLEQTNGRVQHLVLDVEGEFHTLRERFDYVLAACTGGEVVAEPRLAGALAHKLLKLGASAILDLYELKAHERVRFVQLFLEALIDAPKDLWHPALVVIDEAHVFCPQAGECESAAAVKDLLTRGRKRGFCGVLATQRLSKLHKDAAAECNAKLIGRASMDVDMKRAADELGFASREDVLRLRTLEPGEFFAFGPGLSPQVVAVKVGDVVTTHPRAGEAAVPVPPPREKVQKVLAQLADLPREADEEARTLAQAKAEITKLRRELAAKPAPKVERVEVPLLTDAQLECLTKAAGIAGKAVSDLFDVSRELAAAAGKAIPPGWRGDRLALNGTRTLPATDGHTQPAGSRFSTAAVPPARAVPSSPRVVHGTKEPVRPGSRPDGGDLEALTGPEQRILDAIAWLEATNGAEAQNQAAVAFLAGYTVGGGAFNNPRGRLNSRGLIEYRGGDLALTDGGRACAANTAASLTSAELHERVLARLPGPEQKLLRVLLDAYPHDVGNDDLARRAGYEPGGGAFNNPRGRLRSIGLVTYPRKGAVAAAAALFVEGAR